MAAPFAVESLSAAELEIIRRHRELMVDKSYQLLPLGTDAAAFLRLKRKVYTPNTQMAYEATLDKFCRHFPQLEIESFEPPEGTELVEAFLDHWWADKRPATYNRHLAALREFFKFERRRGRMRSDPTEAIEPAKKRQIYRTTFTPDQSRAIIANQDEPRDRLALRLLVYYGLRRSSLQAIQFRHFDHLRKTLAVFAKGGRVRRLPIPDPAFWDELGRLIIESEAEPHHYLMQARWANRHSERYTPSRPMSANGLHRWWYRCLTNAGIVAEGTTSGERMHKARHTAGQNVLDKTKGNLQATRKLLGHASIQTTADTYTDWDDYQLAATLAEILLEGEDE